MDTITCNTGQVYNGDIVSSAKYDPPNSLRMSTDIRDFPFRVIMMKNVVKVNNDPFIFTETKSETRTAQGSNGNIYTIKTVAGTTTCSCPGFQFRGTCKHVNG